MDDLRKRADHEQEVGEESHPPSTEEHYIKKARFPTCRHVLAFMGFLGFFNVYCLRVNLSVALVAMVKTVPKNVTNVTYQECPGQNVSDNSSSQQGEFEWDPNLQGLVLGSFFYGYIVTQVPGGWLAEQFGGKYLYGLGVLCTSVLTLLTPIAVRTNVYLFIAVRVLEGLGEGVTFPAMHAILAKWAPPLERSKLGTFIYAGAQLGTVFSLPISGILCHSNFFGGWPSVFYVFGAAGCVWFIFWVFLAYDSPAQHPRISPEERHTIETAIGHTAHKPPTPWKEIFLSVPFWTLLFAHFCQNWGFYTLLTCLPTYMKNVLQFNISTNGILSAIPYLLCWIMMNVSGQVADFLRSRQILSTTVTRKLFNFTGLGLPGIFIIIVGYMGCDKTLAVVMLTIAVGTGGLTAAGFQVNHLDIAPPFAGTLLGLTNAAATIPGFAGPQVVGLLTSKNETRAQWQKVFYISSAIYWFGAIQYVIFGSGEEQKWSKVPGTDKEPLITNEGDSKEDEEKLKSYT